MTDNTNKEGDNCFFEVNYNKNTHTLNITMHTIKLPGAITHSCKYAHPINYIKVALDECAQMQDTLNSTLKSLKEKE